MDDAVSADAREQRQEFLTTEDLAAKLHRPIGTIRNWRLRSYGPRGFRVGNAVLYRREVVDAWIAGQEQAEADRQPSA
ncbi:helix-turn-helix transcriptional regulator [Parafrankia elaeagni]|uniref:helix-turn-helix transcriptional regulator n=1 Tax=Parafrankia elaeagni TaxID=222534 RepID=UPI00037C4D9B|nr:helix-turn-helix domain-containing protein [Parafrankia elaeagni]